MYFNLVVPAYQNNTTTNYKINIGNKEFKTLTIGKDSYIVGANVETGLGIDGELYRNYGCYNLQIGKYCALAEDILFMINMNHDFNSVAQGCFAEFKEKPIPTKIKRKGQVIIENDVWIGHGATIMNGVTIHNGAVVAANSVVTKEVPPYAIVGGNPAKVIRYRFPADIVEKLLKISWWNWTSEEISSRYEDFAGDTVAFTEKYFPAAEEDFLRAKSAPTPVEMKSGENFLFAIDYDDEFPLYKKIIREFCNMNNKTQNQLILMLNGDEITVKEMFNEISKELDKYNEKDVFIYIYTGLPENLVPHIDTYITGRINTNIYLMELAEKFGKRIISGVDLPLFN